MAQIRIHNNKTGVTYVYEGENYYDKESKRTRTKKRLIGKLDAEGNIVPTGKRGPSSKAKSKVAGYSHSDAEYDALITKNEQLLKDSAEKDRVQAETLQQLKDIKTQLNECKAYMRKIALDMISNAGSSK